MTYTVSWRRRRAFAKSGLVERQCQTLAQARKTMKMASMTEPDFVAVGITDSAGRQWPTNLADGDLTEPDYSEQDYIDNGFDFVEEWPRRSVDDGGRSVDDGGRSVDDGGGRSGSSRQLSGRS